jgi:hypothetical protein
VPTVYFPRLTIGLVHSVPMVAAEYVAKLDETFDPVPQFGQLYEINEKEKYLEEWRLNLLLGLIGNIITFQLLLRFGWLYKHISTVAWVARNLLEIAVWTDYCCASLDNSRRLYEDAFRDSRDMIKAADAMVPLYLARDSQSPIKASQTYLKFPINAVARYYKRDHSDEIREFVLR